MRDPKYIAQLADKVTVQVHLEDGRLSTPIAGARGGSIGTTSQPGQVVKDDCRVMKSSSRSLAIIRNLPSTALILLLTPVTTPITTKPSNPDAKPQILDPFEAFGREISKSHKRVRHVPYVPKTGWTETHEAWLTQAAAVVVVTCQPSPAQEQNAEQQSDFVSALADARWESLPDPQAVPYILMQFNGDVIPGGHNEYENELHADVFTPRSAAHAAELLFKSAA